MDENANNATGLTDLQMYLFVQGFNLFENQPTSLTWTEFSYTWYILV